MVERGEDSELAAWTAPARTGRSHIVGVTGAPGSGKSTLVDRLVGQARAGGNRVAVLAIDPTSPVTGGAVLGDRLRMQDHASDPDVFVRSMATRGALGGLAPATRAVTRVLEAASWPWILIETVGVGQAEIDVSNVADTTVVVVTPGWGDEIQTAKAGVLETADLFVVNKADRPGADLACRDLESMLDLSPGRAGRRPPVLRTVATTGDGVDGLWETISGRAVKAT